jgi:hypothetical protein
MDVPTLTVLFAAAAWMVSLAVALKAVPALAARRVSEQFGLVMVEQDGKRFYAPVDPTGEPIKVPVGVQEVNGEQVVVMKYAPLAYALPFMAADMAAMKVKMVLLGAKGNMSKAVQGRLMNMAAEGSVGADAIMPFLPKKFQGALAIAKVLGDMLNKNAPAGDTGHQAVIGSYGGQK